MSKNKSKLNLKNFDILMQAILDNYQSFNVYVWGENCSRQTSPCGTHGCIAGTADWLANREGMEPAKGCKFLFNKNGSLNTGYNNDYHARLNAEKWLGLTDKQGTLLFIPSRWPELFQDAMGMEHTNEHARIAVSRIQYFLATGK